MEELIVKGEPYEAPKEKNLVAFALENTDKFSQLPALVSHDSFAYISLDKLI